MVGTSVKTWMKALVLGAGLAAPCFADQAPEGYHFMFFKERIPLALDTARVAVFSQQATVVGEEARGNAQQQVVEALGEWGFNADQVKKHSWPGWSYATIDAQARAQGGVRQLVEQMAEGRAADFVSPVFIDEVGPRVVTRDLMIGFHADVTQEEADALVIEQGLGEIVSRQFGGLANTYLVRTTSRNGFEVLDRANALALSPQVAWAEPDMVFTTKTTVIPNDTRFGNLWGIRNTGQSGGVVDADMDGDEAWDFTIGTPNIITVVLDDGIKLNHEDLTANLVSSADFTGSGTGGDHISTNSCEGHGTTVAGCIVAAFNNARGVVGIAPGTRVASAKFTVLNQPCDGTGSGASSATVSALNHAINIGARVTNTSYSIGQSSAIESAFQNSRNQGIVHFASNGNSGANSIAYPASSQWVRAVGALNRFNQKASFSQFGFDSEFSTPGEQIDTTVRNSGVGTYGFVNGTSFASPYAAGVCALLFSRNNLLSATDAENILRNSCVDLGTPGYDTTFGYGHLNARLVMQNTPPPGPPGAFNLSTPAGGATQVARLATFTWESSLSALSYEVTVDDNADFSSPVHTATVQTLTHTMAGTPLAHSTMYHWRVRAINSLGNVLGTPNSRSFTTISLPPVAFNLSAPNNGAVQQPLTPSFLWIPAERGETYQIQVDNNPDFSSPEVSANTASNSFQPASPLSPGQTYSWRVFASNPLGTTQSAQVFTFTTFAQAPSSFQLLSPADASEVGTFTPTLDWSDANGAESYRVQIADNLGFSNPAVNQPGIAGSSFVVPEGALLNNTLYYWRVFAANPIGETVSSPSAFNFALIVVPPCCRGNADKISPGGVTFGDVTMVLGNFGQNYGLGNSGLGDADCDSDVDFGDITDVLSRFGSSCP